MNNILVENMLLKMYLCIIVVNNIKIVLIIVSLVVVMLLNPRLGSGLFSTCLHPLNNSEKEILNHLCRYLYQFADWYDEVPLQREQEYFRSVVNDCWILNQEIQEIDILLTVVIGQI